MVREQVVEGLILRRWGAHEADKWVSLLTREQGKLRLRVKGAYKPTSRMGMLAEPLNIVRTRVVQGRHQRLMVQPQMVSTFLRVRSELERLSAALALLELIDRWLPEEHAEPAVYETAVAALTALERVQESLTVMGWALWRLLSLLGYCPQLDACARCGRADPNEGWVLNADEGQLLCARCGGGRTATRLSSEQVTTLRDWVQRDSPPDSPVPDAAPLLSLATRYAEHYLDDSARWLEFLHRLRALPDSV